MDPDNEKFNILYKRLRTRMDEAGADDNSKRDSGNGLACLVADLFNSLIA